MTAPGFRAIVTAPQFGARLRSSEVDATSPANILASELAYQIAALERAVGADRPRALAGSGAGPSAGRRSRSTATVVLRATVQRIDSDAALRRLRLRLYDRRLELDRPIQTNRYIGDTTAGGLSGKLASGTANMKDQPKPLIYGRVYT